MFARGQGMDNTLQKLIDNNLVEKKQSKEFEELLNKKGTKTHASYLYSLFQIEFKKLTGEYYTAMTHFSFGDEKPDTTEQTKMNKELSQYLLKLKSCDLITERQVNSIQVKITKSEFVHLLQLLTAVSQLVALNEYMSPEKLKAFADKLKSKDIVSKDYDKLLADIEANKLENPFDFVKYCSKTVIINEQDYPNDPENYLELIHQKTASIFPELGFTNFEFQIFLDSSISDKDSKFYDFVVSLKSNGKKYKQKSSYRLYSPDKNQYYGNKIDQQEYYKIFNKVLADLQFPYRLHEVKAYEGDAVEWQTFGILALTKEQADLLHGGNVFFTPSYESFQNKLTSKKTEQAILEFQKVGLLTHLNAGHIEKAKEKVAEQENTKLNDVLMAFPDVIHIFDTELSNLKDPYAELIREYKKISHNAFNATEISDDFDIEKKKKVTVKFKIGGKSYSKAFKIENDWIDTAFFSFINSVVAEQHLTGQFYELYAGGQEASVIYLTKEQYDYLRANKLLVFGDEWSVED